MLLMAGIVAYSHRFTHSVADFISGGRCAERYLLAVASNTGAIVFAALFEMISKSGFVLNWWGYLTPIILLVVGIYGFVGYRLRETRALSLAQFFELRYSKSFRVFAGILGAISGLACDGIIAAVEARFFVYFLGLPETFTVGSWTLATYVPLMALFLAISASISLFGGFVAVMLIDCIEGILAQVFFLLLIYTLLHLFSWSQITTALGNRPPGESLFNPFDAGKVEDFNIWFVMMGIFVSIYTTGAWRNSNGNNTAPLNAHEGRMGGLLSKWRDIGKGEVILLLSICGMTFLAHPDFSAQARVVHEQLSHISQEQIQEQMRIPVAISHFLPEGIKDAFCMLLLLEMVCGTANWSQSWASILIQDVFVPLRKAAFPPERHLFLLKVSVLGVMLFFFVFGALFRQTQYIIMWFTVAGSIFLGGAGSVIIGGLYWKKGTTAAAWIALITGSTLAVSGILANQIYDKAFPLNGVQVSFFASVISIVTYIVVSLLTCRADFDMDRMLHRGKYAPIKKLTGEEIKQYETRNLLLRAIGIDQDFSLGDKCIAVGLFAWMLLWFVVFVFGTIWNVLSPWPVSVWMTYWHITAIGIPIAITLVTTVWFTWGGSRDILRLFRRLKREKLNPLDNGMVIGHTNAGDLALEEKIH
jgi:SSS family solute:Na+ symporter